MCVCTVYVHVYIHGEHGPGYTINVMLQCKNSIELYCVLCAHVCSRVHVYVCICVEAT